MSLVSGCLLRWILTSRVLQRRTWCAVWECEPLLSCLKQTAVHLAWLLKHPQSVLRSKSLERVERWPLLLEWMLSRAIGPAWQLLVVSPQTWAWPESWNQAARRQEESRGRAVPCTGECKVPPALFCSPHRPASALQELSDGTWTFKNFWLHQSKHTNAVFITG